MQHATFLSTVGLVLVLAFAVGCRGGQRDQSRSAVRETPAGDSGPESAADDQEPLEPVAYDGEGVPLPDQRRLALGTAIPRGFKRLHAERGSAQYQGPIPPEKLLSFYQKFLHSPRVVQVKRGWTFHDATPRLRGDETRRVRVDVIKVGHRRSTVSVTDLMGREKAPGPPKKTVIHEDLRKAAHSGRASPSRPIPGTY